MTVLDKIKSYKLEEIAARKAERSLEDISDAARSAPAVRGFADRLIEATKTGYGLIAEIKKASPSKGLIRPDFDPPALAAAYEAAGAACLSVLTDAPSFQGSEEFLVAAREACNLPVIRKDFLYDPWQVAEARSIGADAILIIMASVSDDQAMELEAAAIEWEMDVLVEVHDREELDRAAALKSPLLGINNRDLHTFEVSLNTTKSLIKFVPDGKVIVSESGFMEPSDMTEVAQYGVRAFLIGEAMMRKPDVEAATRAMLANPYQPQGGM